MILPINGERNLKVHLTKTKHKAVIIGVDKLLRLGWKIYLIITCLLGSLVLVCFLGIIVVPVPVADKYNPIKLPSGFILGEYRLYGETTYSIYNQGLKSVILPNIISVIHYNTTIYGSRKNLAGVLYYFICTYDRDCNETQRLSEAEFRKMIKEQGLPAYDNKKAINYHQLLQRKME